MRRLCLGVIASAIALFGFSSLASAHTGDIKVSAVCNTQTGNYDLTATLTTSQVPYSVTGSSKWRIGTSNFEGTPTNANGMDRGPIVSVGNTTVTLGTWSVPGTTTGLGPWVYAYTTWSNGTKRGSDGQLTTALKGDCKVPVVKDASASVSITPPSCTVPAKLVLGSTVYASFGVPTRTTGPGSYSVTATASSGHVFADGQPTKTFSGTLADKLDPNEVVDCRPEQPASDREVRPVVNTPDCVALTVTSYNEERMRSYAWDKTTSSWVAGTWSSWTKVEGSEQSRPATAEECPPPVIPPVVPPVEPPVPPVAPEKPSVKITKVVVGKKTVRSGAVVTFRVRVTNTSKTVTTTPVVMRDVIPKGMVALKGQKLQKGAIVRTSNLTPGQGITYILRMKVSAPKGKVCNIATASTPGIVARSSKACVTVKPAPAKPIKVPVTG